MNDGSAILLRQNAPDIIEMQAAQRQLYSESKRHAYIMTVGCLAIPLIATIVQIVFAVASMPFPVYLLIEIVSFSIDTLFSKKAKTASLQAAGIQQSIDSDVYGMAFAGSLRDKAVIKSAAMRYRAAAKSEDDFRGWYLKEIEGLSPAKAVSMCQRENISWTKRLFCRVEILLIGSGIICFAAIVTPIIVMQIDPMNIVFLVSIGKWIFSRIRDAVKLSEAIRKLDFATKNYTLARKDDIVTTQQRIIEYRWALPPIPDWMYKLRRNKDNEYVCLAVQNQ